MADQFPDHFATELRDALILASTAGTIASPVTHSQLLELIVETAIQVIAVRAGALFLMTRSPGTRLRRRPGAQGRGGAESSPCPWAGALRASSR